MTWTLGYNSELSIIEAVFTGRTDGMDVQVFTAKAIALGQQHGCLRYFTDASNIELQTSTLDIYDLPNRQYQALGLDRQSRVAIVLPISLKEFEIAKYFETSCNNAGWCVRTFSTRDQAIEWLIGVESVSK